MATRNDWIVRRKRIAYHGFLWNGSSFTTLDDPLSIQYSSLSTYPKAISGNKIVGIYYGAVNVTHGFLYNGSSWTTLDFPGGHDTSLEDIQGNTIVGRYTDAGGVIHGFIATIPEPSSFILTALGLIGLAAWGWGRKR